MTTTVKVFTRCDENTQVSVHTAEGEGDSRSWKLLAVMKGVQVQEFLCSPSYPIMVEEGPIPLWSGDAEPGRSL